ncbi:MULTISPECIES: hypothetical protein [Niallia]|uniref:Uncharacterized protein n=1 Tax=Niallia circulans TaxID=1397 RepID=A0A268FF28_NIACI|nr:hypothetical protein [Niallia circulans]AYV68413.1 hypothetical protein C2I06_16925 [Niallia circulans]AYV73186.1 hypothetical protein C2H98_17410 [Niallia circulans]NRG26651.1 hypothetical protein [Niallia circulans]PAD83949.1 hypothetical protein CHH57_06945 [Niallia circulans]QJX64328.1 hypothetical protein HLK66_23560 [Niallia circulans]
MRKLWIWLGMPVYIVVFSFLYKHQLGSIGFFLLSLLFFKLAKNKHSKITGKEKENFYFEEKLNKP